ncbi:TIR domain-containing protein [Nonomuraea sp. 10N515B]|uniref:TIR domain-containing protein n=1 Tax=Nonomuraea sp. 10N515B TaxID=3457422 RepID=UPI003FCD4C8F
MKIFLSWSKQLSHQMALVLRAWLPEVIQQVEPWMSSEDIDKGQRWATEIGTQLSEVDHGIICVTKENLQEPWLNFEAGALAKSLQSARVRPVLLGVQSSSITGPLAQFQATAATNKNDTHKLVSSLNDACAAPLDIKRLERAFERNWQTFVDEIDNIRHASDVGVDMPRRSADDLLGEVLDRIRDLQRSIEVGPATSQGRPSSEDFLLPLLGDGSVGRPGLPVVHDLLGEGVVKLAVNAPSIHHPDGAVTVVFKSGRRALVPSQNLRRSSQGWISEAESENRVE